MQYIELTLTSLQEPIFRQLVTARGLHGMLFNILTQTDQKEADWLHKHNSPRPFSLAILCDDSNDILTGIRLAAITERASALFIRAGAKFQEAKHICHLGRQKFIVDEVQIIPGPDWHHLAQSQPARKIGLRFTSPTVFKQGPGHLPLPIPVNVFHSPVFVWKTFAPSTIQLPSGWLDWCQREVFLVQHRIETKTVNINKKDQITGFIGEVWFKAHQGDELTLSFWQALADLASFCGVGYKTTMGMGTTEKIQAIYEFN